MSLGTKFVVLGVLLGLGFTIAGYVLLDAVVFAGQVSAEPGLAQRALTTFSIMFAAGSALFVAAGWWFLGRKVVAPLRSLADQMPGVGVTGRLDVAALAVREDEIGALSAALDSMVDGQQAEQAQLTKARDQAVAIARAKSEFLAHMSHEIRTPMNGVLGMTELLRGSSLDDKQRQFADTAYESAESLLRIINDILDFSKLEAGKVRLSPIGVDLCSLVEETVEGLAAPAYSKGLELMTRVPTQLPNAVRVDPVRLRQVLTNLVGNAIKFTARGEVIVTLEANEAGDNCLDVRIAVEDTGIGISGANQERIFDSFSQEDGATTRLYGGTGLGLAISKQLVEQMGGALTVKSERGKGATFSFSLRLNICPNSAPAVCGPAQNVAGQRILIVDDNETNREILEHQLGSWRALVSSAASAADALVVLQDALADGAGFHLAILDMHMPDADGLALARAIRAQPGLATLKLLILSSLAAPLADTQLAELGIAGQLTKPVRQARLYDSLVTVLGGDKVRRHQPKERSITAGSLRGKILVAEDNPVNQAVVQGVLESLGLKAVITHDGREAVARLATEHFDAVLMDCQMPIMDGFDATRAIRRAESLAGSQHTPIIAVTANAMKGDRELCLAAGMDEYLTKPFSSEQLHSVLASFLPASAVPDAAVVSAADAMAATALRRAESPLDANTLGLLTRLQRPGAPNIMRKVINIYLQSSRVLVDRLSAALEASHPTVALECAHALKSSSVHVGATGLANLCKSVETMARERDMSNSPNINAELEREYVRVVDALKSELAAKVA